ncbi:hypothetical protein VTN00DRAFT_5997 [Thermoascus crustaceus]|uniref:uncharacterized protein n=1 Tax=Thermoascus crustaceus TaxID=5088 RepID=UPI0037445603
MRSCSTRRIVLQNLTARCPRSRLPILSSSPTFSRSRTGPPVFSAKFFELTVDLAVTENDVDELESNLQAAKEQIGLATMQLDEKEAHLASKEDEFKEKRLSQPQYPCGTRPWTISDDQRVALTTTPRNANGNPTVLPATLGFA